MRISIALIAAVPGPSGALAIGLVPIAKEAAKLEGGLVAGR
jgi:hypothetical protein